MAVLKNRAKMSTSTTGTGTITLGSAESGYQTFADAGVANADVVRYVIEDGNNWEIGTGTYTATGTTLSRTVSESSNADAAINLSGSATVFIGATAEDIPDLYADNAVNATTPVASGTNAVAIGSSSVANSSAAIALGDSALAYGSDTLVLQKGRASGSQATSIAVHNNSSAYGSNHLGAVSIGSHAKSTQDYSFALGWYSQANANYAMAFGRGANAGHISSVAIGHNAATTSANQIALGSTSDTVKISGTYTLPTSDGTNGQVLTTDGAGAVTFADAGGGSSTITVDSKTAAYTIVSGDVGKLISFSGGSYTASLTAAATLGNGFYVYIENNAANNQNTHVVTIDPDASETIDGRSTMPLRQGQRILIVCDGSNWKTVADFNRAIATNARIDFFNLPQATGAESVAIGLGSVASNTNTTAIGLGAEATGSYATSFGTSTEATAFGSVASGYNAVSAGSQSIALGVSRASGADSIAAAIANNTSSYGATGSNSVAIGQSAKATGNNSFAHGQNSIASTTHAVAIGVGCTTTGQRALSLGDNSLASANYSFSIGRSTTASYNYSYAFGYNTKANRKGTMVYGGGSFSSQGDAQCGTTVLRNATTDATATVLTSDGSTAAGVNEIQLPNNSAYSFSGTIIARQQAAGGSNYARWEIKGALLRDATAASTVLGNGIVNKLYATSGASAWAVALTADTTNGGLKVEVTGAAATNIRWVATVNTSEVTYA